jgi:hypothetical protein
MGGALHPHILTTSTSRFLETKVFTTDLLFFGCLVPSLMLLSYILEFPLISKDKGYGDRILFGTDGVLVVTNEVFFPFKAAQLYCRLKPCHSAEQWGS